MTGRWSGISVSSSLLGATMNQKSSLPQAAKSVSRVLVSDTRHYRHVCAHMHLKIREKGWPARLLWPCPHMAGDHGDPRARLTSDKMTTLVGREGRLPWNRGSRRSVA